MLDRAVRCAGSRTLTVKVALTPGSSQQGKALRSRRSRRRGGAGGAGGGGEEEQEQEKRRG